MRDGIGDDDATQLTTIERLNRPSTQDAMRDDGDDLLGMMMHDGIGGFDERATRVGHVIDENGDLALDVTDEDHPRDFVRTSSLFVDQGEAEIETVRDGRRSVLPPRSISLS